MPKYRQALPQLSSRPFLADGGIETSLIFHDGIDLPYFAAFTLLDSEEGRAALRAYYEPYARLAKRVGTGFILESPTWRASRDWAEKLGMSSGDLDRLNRKAIDLMVELREAFEGADTPMVISGCIGPRGDGYKADVRMSVEEAQAYHSKQVGSFGVTAADLVTAITMTYPEEAIGIARAAQAAGLPVVISFTTETDGRLPDGHEIGEAIEMVDRATGAAPAYYMINCAHPSHFEGALKSGSAWLGRIAGIRANASAKSHAELDESTSLDRGDPAGLGRQYAQLRAALPRLNIYGGCCGTDHHHIEEIASACIGGERVARPAAA